MSETLTPTTTVASQRNLWLVVGGLGLAGIGLAAGLMLRAPAAAPEAVADSPAATAQAGNSGSNTAKAATGNSGNKAQGKQAAAGNGAQRAAERPPLDTQSAALCAHCGVIEGVRPVQRKGEGSGVGAVAGGVLGAVVGNQMGAGSGKTAMTVLGAVGGGFAGNEVEKRTKTTTVYEVKVRMDDGTLRTFTSDTAPTPGAPVTVSDKGFQVVNRSEGNGAPRVTRTAG
ncbi:glycine zipper 2TM domain-containing protein [Rubrivivax sp. A210]|uniref:glycine zipper 2TM domain-containing protein n=1 Tax=Rubrivivax sp. A210 TaxID=2772301 RepID=UPI002873F2B5|nr:glycine zipper 2TM domain-containing protein [Rubrivivax sp. A210]